MSNMVRHRRTDRGATWPPRSQYRRRWAFLGLVALAVLLLIFDGEPTPQGTLVTQSPPEAVGRWTTGDARYAGRALVVTPATVTLELGAGVPAEVGHISAVRVWTEGENSVVHLEYVTDQGLQDMDMLLEGNNRMRLRNPREVLWTRGP